MGVLERILGQKRQELPQLRARKLPAPPAIPPVALKRDADDPLRLICEIKRKSPSAGELSRKLSVTERARRYQEGGASMISVLCDETFFAGSYAHLLEARRGAQLPLLCKEFIIDESQLEAARAYGASAALLIVRCLDGKRLTELMQACSQLELVPLVEVITLEEARMALDAGATHVGINSRDLDTLMMDEARARDVLDCLPSEVVRCKFSGVSSASAVSEVSMSGVDAALIGEILMRQDDPAPLLEAFAQAARNPVS